MKKGLIVSLLVVILLLGLLGCGKADVANPADRPADPSGEATPAPANAGGEIDSANTAEELRALILTYQESGDQESAYLAAKKLITLVPSDTQAYQDAIAALLGSIEGDYQEIQELIQLGIQNAPDGADRFAQWVNEQDQTFSFTVPFFADYASESEINLVGTTAGNLTNLEVPSADLWLYGLMTRQGSWVYFALPQDDYGIYKMRVDGTGIKKIADARGDSINVVGDWIFYRNPSDEGMTYRIRTDGTGKEGPLSNSASSLAVTKDSIYYLDRSIYKTNTDTGETISLVGGENASMSVYDGWIYYCTGGNNSEFCRISVDGGEPQKLCNGWMIHYDMLDGWIYYHVNVNGDSVWRMRPDGSEQTELYRSENPLIAFAVVKDHLVVSVSTEVDDRGKPTPTELRLLDIVTGAVLKMREAGTSAIFVANDSVFYTENGVWQLWNLSTDSVGLITYSAATKEVSITAKSAVSLTALGFELDPKLGIYSYRNDDLMATISIVRPDLGESQEEYNMVLLKEVNGYMIGVWYYEKDNNLVLQAVKGEIDTKYCYDLANKTYGNEWSSIGSVQEQFEAAFGKQEGDFHDVALKLFTDTIQECFGMSWQELYALPLI